MLDDIEIMFVEWFLREWLFYYFIYGENYRRCNIFYRFLFIKKWNCMWNMVLMMVIMVIKNIENDICEKG